MPRGSYDRSAPNGKKKWTESEDRYLEEHWGSTSLGTIAKNLGRSENAVVVRIQRLHIGPGLMNGNRISFSQFTQAVYGIKGYTYLKNRLTKVGFPFHSQIIRGHNHKRFTTVDIDEFWKFAEQNKDLFDFSRMEPFALGPEPEWATLKRKLDTERLRKGHSHNDRWTEDEDRLLEDLLKEYRYTYKDLAEKLHRTEGAIKRRIVTRGIRERPVKNENRLWTTNEEQKLIEMRSQGYGWDNIAEELGRTALCVRGKYERMLNPEYMKQYARRERHDESEREKLRSNYIGIRELKPEEIFDHREAVALHSQAEFTEVQTL